MPRYTSKDGKQTIETSSAREGVNLRAQGFTESKARTAQVRQTDAADEKPAPTPSK